jgi:hypothetical protein
VILVIVSISVVLLPVSNREDDVIQRALGQTSARRCVIPRASGRVVGRLNGGHAVSCDAPSPLELVLRSMNIGSCARVGSVCCSFSRDNQMSLRVSDAYIRL